MSQYSFGNLSSPLSGTALIDTHLEPWRDALHTNHSGSAAPSYIAAGMIWIDTTTNPWLIKVYDGADHITIGSVNTTTNQFTPSNAGVSDGDKGDVVVSSSGTVWTIDSNVVTTAMLQNNSVTLAKLATQAANTVLVNATAGAAVPTALALAASELIGRGSSGNIAPITLGAGLSMSGAALISSVVGFTGYYESSEQTLAANSTVTVTHGLGGTPKLMQCELVCKTADIGFAVGDRLVITSYVLSNYGFTCLCNATDLSVVVDTSPLMIRKDTYAQASLTVGSWKIVMRAWI